MMADMAAAAGARACRQADKLPAPRALPTTRERRARSAPPPPRAHIHSQRVPLPPVLGACAAYGSAQPRASETTPPGRGEAPGVTSGGRGAALRWLGRAVGGRSALHQPAVGGLRWGSGCRPCVAPVPRAGQSVGRPQPAHERFQPAARRRVPGPVRHSAGPPACAPPCFKKKKRQKDEYTKVPGKQMAARLAASKAEMRRGGTQAAPCGFASGRKPPRKPLRKRSSETEGQRGFSEGRVALSGRENLPHAEAPSSRAGCASRPSTDC